MQIHSECRVSRVSRVLIGMKEKTSLFLFGRHCPERGRRAGINSCNREVLILVQMTSCWRCTEHTHTHPERKTNSDTLSDIEWQNEPQPLRASSMEDAELLSIHSNSTGPQCWWRPLPRSLPPPSCFPSAGWEEEKKKWQEHIPLIFFLSPWNKSRLLTAAGARGICAPASQSIGCASKVPAYFLFSQPFLDGDAQLTHSSQLPPFCGHMIWAITK